MGESADEDIDLSQSGEPPSRSATELSTANPGTISVSRNA